MYPDIVFAIRHFIKNGHSGVPGALFYEEE
jgi:hypothetical protein